MTKLKFKILADAPVVNQPGGQKEVALKNEPVEGVCVQLYISGADECIVESNPSNDQGEIELELSTEAEELVKSCQRDGELSGINLLFMANWDSGEKPTRPTLINRVGLYCEGRNPVDLLKTGDSPETRLIRKAIRNLTEPEFNAFGREREGKLKELIQASGRCVLVTGPTGVGKSSLLGQLVYSDFYAPAMGAFCTSFEVDNSAFSFGSSLLRFLTCDDQRNLSLDKDQMIGLLARSKPLAFVIDAVDEISCSGRDGVYGKAIKEVLGLIVQGADGLEKHRLLMTAQSVPTFLNGIYDRIDHLEISRDQIRVKNRFIESRKDRREYGSALPMFPKIRKLRTELPSVVNRLDSIRSRLLPGDLLLSYSKSFVSEAIREFTNAKWSHVGLLCKKDSDWFVFESSNVSNFCHDTKVCRAGVQLVLLSDWLIRHMEAFGCQEEEVDVAVAWQPLLYPKSMNGARMQNKVRGFSAAIRNFRSEIRGRPYETDLSGFWYAIEAQFFGRQSEYDTEDLSSLFCSELVAEAYQRMGLLDSVSSSNQFVPADFSGEMASDRQPLLLDGFEFGAPVALANWSRATAIPAARRCKG